MERREFLSLSLLSFAPLDGVRKYWPFKNQKAVPVEIRIPISGGGPALVYSDNTEIKVSAIESMPVMPFVDVDLDGFYGDYIPGLADFPELDIIGFGRAARGHVDNVKIGFTEEAYICSFDFITTKQWRPIWDGIPATRAGGVV